MNWLALIQASIIVAFVLGVGLIGMRRGVDGIFWENPNKKRRR